jgi:hypothetical protein
LISEDIFWNPVKAHSFGVFIPVSSVLFHKFCYLWNL